MIISKDRAADMVGPYSDGSLRPADVAYAFARILSDIRGEVQAAGEDVDPRFLDVLAALERIAEPDGREEYDGELGDLVDAAVSVACEYLPECYMPGHHPDDPACIGIWHVSLYVGDDPSHPCYEGDGE